MGIVRKGLDKCLATRAAGPGWTDDAAEHGSAYTPCELERGGQIANANLNPAVPGKLGRLSCHHRLRRNQRYPRPRPAQLRGEHDVHEHGTRTSSPPSRRDVLCYIAFRCRRSDRDILSDAGGSPWIISISCAVEPELPQQHARRARDCYCPTTTGWPVNHRGVGRGGRCARQAFGCLHIHLLKQSNHRQLTCSSYLSPAMQRADNGYYVNQSCYKHIACQRQLSESILSL